MRGCSRRISLAVGLVLLGCRGSEAPAREAPAPEPSPRDEAPSEAAPAPNPEQARKRACLDAALAAAPKPCHTLLRALCAESVEREVPGFAVAVVEPGAAPFHFERGVRCFGDPAAVEASTPFRLGSVSKTVSAALALGLVDDERLQLEDRASAHVAGFHPQAGLPDPRLADLLRHRSGLGEIEPAILVELQGAWLPALTRSPAAGAPGDYRYSNTGYALVGAMVEAAARRPYAALVAERVAAPLQLRGLSADVQRLEAPACGHLEHDQDRHPIPVTEDLAFMPGDPRWMDPAGGVLASAVDLARFALALGSEELPGTDAMLEPGPPMPPAEARRPDERYGLGLRSWELGDGTRAYAHSGNNGAFTAELLFVPGRRAVVVLGNRGVALPASVAAAEALLQLP